MHACMYVHACTCMYMHVVCGSACMYTLTSSLGPCSVVACFHWLPWSGIAFYL